MRRLRRCQPRGLLGSDFPPRSPRVTLLRMDLLMIRHAIAGDRDEFAKSGRPDAERPVTPAGARKMRLAARGLRSAVGAIDLLATSPLRRARQTAEIVGRVYGDLEAIEMAELGPDVDPSRLLKRLNDFVDRDVVAVVGHEPALSRTATLLLANRRDSLIEMKKGAACLLRCDADVRPGAAMLVWSLSPRLLRRLAR